MVSSSFDAAELQNSAGDFKLSRLDRPVAHRVDRFAQAALVFQAAESD